MDSEKHFHYMSMALRLAELGRFSVSPNPMVGCVLVKESQIIGQGFHQRAGEPHAEINALQNAVSNVEGATAYITLEPCCHVGKTPPCIDALIQSGIKKIYVACLDPNPLVSGKGIEKLKSAGISVNVGLCAQAAQQLNEKFFYYITHKRPFVIAKWAMSLDGKTIVNQNDSRNISGAESHDHAHQIRSQVDAILVGGNTARLDNPQLTVRLKKRNVKQPIRIILASQGNLSFDLNIFNSQANTIVATTNAVDKNWLKTAIAKQIEVLVLPNDENKNVHVPSLLRVLGEKEITSVLVEGGLTVHQSFFKENLVNKIQFYLCPVIISSLEKKRSVANLKLSKLGEDFYFSGNYEGANHV